MKYLLGQLILDLRSSLAVWVKSAGARDGGGKTTKMWWGNNRFRHLSNSLRPITQ